MPQSLLEEHIEFDPQWVSVLKRIQDRFGKKPDLEAILFIIGIQELGRLKEKWTKEEKQNLMHIAVGKLLSQDGFYQFAGLDDDGWPHYEVVSAVPAKGSREQEILLKKNIIRYFDQL